MEAPLEGRAQKVGDRPQGGHGRTQTTKAKVNYDWRLLRPRLWVFCVISSVWTARAILRVGFPYPLCFLVIQQCLVFLYVSGIVVLIRLRNVGSPEHKCTPNITLSRSQKHLWTARNLVVTLLSAFGMLCQAQVLLHYHSLSILAIFSISTYVVESVIFRAASILLLIRPQPALTNKNANRMLFICICLYLIVREDHTLTRESLLFALGGSVSSGLSNAFRGVTHRKDKVDQGAHTWDCPLYQYLKKQSLHLVVTCFAAWYWEDIDSAIEQVRLCGPLQLIWDFLPGALPILLWKPTFMAAYPDANESKEYHYNGGALEEDSEDAHNALIYTAIASISMIILDAVIGTTLITWLQSLLYTCTFILSIGPLRIHRGFIGFYDHLRRKAGVRESMVWPQRIVTSDVPYATLSFFTASMTAAIVLWLNYLALWVTDKEWRELDIATLDKSYIQPSSKQFGFVIAHSAGQNPLPAVRLAFAMASIEPYLDGRPPQITVYTNDPSPTFGDLTEKLSAYNQGGNEKGIKYVSNARSITATYIYHITQNWDTLQSHIFFTNTLKRTANRHRQQLNFFKRHFISSTSTSKISTGFLSLGDSMVCKCGSCSDIHGWRDRTAAIPALWFLSQPSTDQCQNLVITNGNSFVVSAARIRSLGKEIYELLYDGLTAEEPITWAELAEKHGHEEMNLDLAGNGESYVNTADLEYTIERLWGILFQCSSRRIAAACPSLYQEWRREGNETDCGCLDNVQPHKSPELKTEL